MCHVYIIDYTAFCKLFALLMLLVVLQYEWTVTSFVIMSLSNQLYAICN